VFEITAGGHSGAAELLLSAEVGGFGGGLSGIVKEQVSSAAQSNLVDISEVGKDTEKPRGTGGRSLSNVQRERGALRGLDRRPATITSGAK